MPPTQSNGCTVLCFGDTSRFHFAIGQRRLRNNVGRNSEILFQLLHFNIIYILKRSGVEISYFPKVTFSERN